MTVSVLDPEIAETILSLGMFERQVSGVWTRQVGETTVRAILEPSSLRLELWPAITLPHQHFEKREAGGVYFEIAAKYAEKVGGRIVQLSNISGCIEDGSQHVLADYPLIPMSWDKVCPGFRETIMGGLE